MTLVTAPRLPNPVRLAAVIGAEPIAATQLGASQRCTASLAVARRLATMDGPAIFAHPFEQLAPRRVGCDLYFPPRSHLLDRLGAMLPTSLRASRSKPMVEAYMTRTAQREAIVGVVCEFGELAPRLDVSAIETSLESAVLAGPICSRQDSELPRPLQLFCRWMLANRNDVIEHTRDCNTQVGGKGGDANGLDRPSHMVRW